MPTASLGQERSCPCDSGGVIHQLATERLAPLGNRASPQHPNGLVAAAAAVRGAAVAISGLIFTAGLALVVWTITPAAGADAGAAMRAGVAGFALANLMPITVGGTSLTLPPLLLTGLIIALLTSVARHGRYLPHGRAQEALAVLVSAGTYGLIVAAATRGFGPPEAVPAVSVWTATGVALCAVAGGTLGRGSAWRSWWRAALPAWAHTGARGGAVGLGVLIAGGGLALAGALIVHFGSAVSVAALAAPHWTDGLGLALLGIVYVPNAVIGGAGYVTGVGFEVGPGTYSPFASSTVELPAVPLLAATPDHSGTSSVGVALLLVPLVAGGLIGWRVVRALGTREERVFAAGVASAAVGVGLGALAWIASGGVGAGRWAHLGSPPLLTAAATFVEVGVAAVAVAALTEARSVPWRAAMVGMDDGEDAEVLDDVVDTAREGDELSDEEADPDLDEADKGVTEADDLAGADEDVTEADEASDDAQSPAPEPAHETRP